MGSATTQALAATTSALEAAPSVDLDVARELFAAVRVLAGSSQLSGALSDASAPAAARQQVVAKVFGGSSAGAVAVLQAAAAERWSSSGDLLSGIEEAAIRAAAIADPKVDIEAELFGVVRTIAANPELELALGSRLGDASAKGALIEKLLGGRASAATVLITSSLVQLPRERRVRSMLSRALRLVADQRGRTVATVYAASALSAEQTARLQRTLAGRYGTEVSVNVVVEPSVVGGVRIEIGDDVIDATVSSRLGDLRQRLAG
ncbi:F0F1 ATP synthase subunit delta [Microbacterium dauci]|uniref:ATP synthase subunit delta n=1 Tax=Microbacterium dauci TaxID=3048008 RepID=A0ABT6ZBN2_9MICO|nr:F0F1 ATP synthase subunit delta [Microbacterium sp. LX3-4]MDJ1113042.1 F0F1 ATP synthase subunit delta [Microbacterium sp. LX3-4]